MSQRHIHVLIGYYAKNHPHISKESRDDYTLNDDEFQYRPRLSSYGFADSKLMSSLLNCNEHDVRNTHYATQQRKDADYPKGSSYDVHSRIHLHILCKPVPKPYRMFVIRSRFMIQIQACTIGLFKVFVVFFGFQTMKSKMQFIGLIPLVIYCSKRIEGRICHIIAPRVILFIDSNDAKAERTHVDMLPNELLNIL